ncbi:MAG: hypothetical protein V4805_03915 [Pseudomonadota bacterium]
MQLISGPHLTAENVAIAGLVPAGHKIATAAIPAGQPVRRYRQIIATRPAK